MLENAKGDIARRSDHDRQPQPPPTFHHVGPPGRQRLHHGQQGQAKRPDLHRTVERLSGHRPIDEAAGDKLFNADRRGPQRAVPGPEHEVVIETRTRP